MARYFLLNEIMGDTNDDRNFSIFDEKFRMPLPEFEDGGIEYDMKVIDRFRGVCRVCADDNAIIPLFNSKLQLLDDMKQYTGIDFAEDDGLPNRLCRKCYDQLIRMRNFKKIANETDSRFKLLKIRHEAKIEKTQGTEEVKKLPSYKPMVSCLKCGKQFSSRVTCKRHIFYCIKPAEPPSLHICETCGREFTKKAFYRRHLRTHSDAMPYKCTLCPHQCKASDSLRIHMRTHTGEKPFQCEQCPKACTTKSNLNKHIRSHKKEHEFTCEECQRGFHTTVELQRHQRAVHLGCKDFPCSYCGKEFAWKKELRKHQIRVHNLEKSNRHGREPDYLKLQRKMQQIEEEKHHQPMHSSPLHHHPLGNPFHTPMNIYNSL